MFACMSLHRKHLNKCNTKSLTYIMVITEYTERAFEAAPCAVLKTFMIQCMSVVHRKAAVGIL